MKITTTTRWLAAALWLATATAAIAADKAYMTQVSELVGIVEAPAYLRDACLHRLPDTRPALRSAYESWRRRHATILAAIAAQVQRAEALAKRQGSRFAVADLGRAGAQLMRERLDGVPPGQARRICRDYDDFLRDLDETMRDTVPRRLRALELAEP